MNSRLIPIMLIWLVIDIYFFQAVKTVTMGLSPITRNTIHWAYWLWDGVLAIIILYFVLSGAFAARPPKGVNWLLGFVILSLVPKLLVTPVLLLEDAGRVLYAGFAWVGRLFSSPPRVEHAALFVGRRKFISGLAIGIAAIPFASLIYGMLKGKYNYHVHRVKLSFKDLPEAFHGFTITQLSDIHAGSFDDAAAVARGVAMANQQNSDLLLFTGDLVNNKADEMEPWMDTFSGLQAPFGKYSVLGNHDYGDYLQWESETAKANNLQRLKEVHKEIGFKLLLNENLQIEKEGQSITLIGVENWGKNGFAQHGDLDKAMTGVEDHAFNILLSHDPSHWEAKTLHHPKHIHLTLAGHTHGMQFGIEVPGFKWSPVKYIYPQWAGAYSKNNKYIYVNRGFGFIGFPGRVGIMPEITVITLTKA